jgi:hypothetical protein
MTLKFTFMIKFINACELSIPYRVHDSDTVQQNITRTHTHTPTHGSEVPPHQDTLDTMVTPGPSYVMKLQH